MSPQPMTLPAVIRSRLGLAVTVAAALCGCMSQPKPQPNSVHIEDDVQRQADRRFAKEPFDDQIRQGVIRQRTVAESQFRPETAELTSIGQRNVTILAEAMKESGGRIAVPRGSASPCAACRSA